MVEIIFKNISDFVDKLMISGIRKVYFDGRKFSFVTTNNVYSIIATNDNNVRDELSKAISDSCSNCREAYSLIDCEGECRSVTIIEVDEIRP